MIQSFVHFSIEFSLLIALHNQRRQIFLSPKGQRVFFNTFSYFISVSFQFYVKFFLCKLSCFDFYLVIYNFWVGFSRDFRRASEQVLKIVFQLLKFSSSRAAFIFAIQVLSLLLPLFSACHAFSDCLSSSNNFMLSMSP